MSLEGMEEFKRACTVADGGGIVLDDALISVFERGDDGAVNLSSFFCHLQARRGAVGPWRCGGQECWMGSLGGATAIDDSISHSTATRT